MWNSRPGIRIVPRSLSLHLAWPWEIDSFEVGKDLGETFLHLPLSPDIPPIFLGNPISANLTFLTTPWRPGQVGTCFQDPGILESFSRPLNSNTCRRAPAHTESILASSVCLDLPGREYSSPFCFWILASLPRVGSLRLGRIAIAIAIEVGMELCSVYQPNPSHIDGFGLLAAVVKCLLPHGN